MVLSAQFPAKSEAIHARHYPIQNNKHGGIRLLQNFPCLFTVHGAYNQIAELAQHALKHEAGGNIVLCDKNPHH